MAAYVPPGWPSGVHPPGSEDFERTAQAWLLDVVPADYRLHGVLRRYPLALAAMAAHHAKACVAGAREGYRNARTEVGGALPPHALEALLAAYRAEGRRLVATAQAVDLVTRALRGEVFTPQLQDGAQPGDRRAAAGQGTHDPGTRNPDAQGQFSARRATANAGAERPPAQRPAAQRPVAQRPVAQRPAAQRPEAGRPVPEQPVPEQPVPEQPVPGAPPAQRLARDGAGKARKAQAQRPARNGGASTRKAKRDQHAAAS